MMQTHNNRISRLEFPRKKLRKFYACNREIQLGVKTLVMGIVNVTPDSFSDGGETLAIDAAVERALSHQAYGADMLDIGGESTRPGSSSISVDEELNRVIPVIQALKGRIKIPISIDTTKAEVAWTAIKEGACIINDISAGTFDKNLPKVAAEFTAGVILMHIQGVPGNMQRNPQYVDFPKDIHAFLKAAIRRFQDAGLRRKNIFVDPGIGFGKLLKHNLSLIKKVNHFGYLAGGVVLGPSRKSFLGLITGSEVDDRKTESVTAAVMSSICGADVVRVHDVRETVNALKVASAIVEIRD